MPIGSIAALNAPFDGDGIVYDNVLWAQPDAALDDIVVDFGPAKGCGCVPTTPARLPSGGTCTVRARPAWRVAMSMATGR